MTKPALVVPLSDLDRGPKSATFSLDTGWLEQALEGTEATPRGPNALVRVELTRSGRDVLVRGHAEAALSMPCVVTLDPVDVDVRPEIFLLLSPAEPPVPSPTTPRKRSARAPAGDEPERGKPAGRRAGRLHVAGQEPPDAVLSPEEAARDTFEGSQIVLDPFVREFILLELPQFPRRSDLPSSEGPAIAPPASDLERAELPIDPRLQPLAAIKSRLRTDKE